MVDFSFITEHIISTDKRMTQTSVLLVGAGQIASVLAQQLFAQGWQVTGLRRQVDKLPANIIPLQADLTDPSSLQVLHDRPFDYVVITLTPDESTEAAYRRIYIDGTHNLLQALKHPPKRILFVSSTSVYHQHQGEWVNETSPTQPLRFNGVILCEAEQLIRRCGVSNTCIRFGGIYGAARTRLLRDVQQGLTSARDQHWSNRIHQDDAVNVLQHLLLKAVRGEILDDCYIAVDDQPVKLVEVKNWMAIQLNLPYRWQTAEASNIGRRCSNHRLKASGFSLQYSDYQAGYRQLILDAQNTT
jgi:nucleoside-diphosphate-sugar epimerase